MRNLLLLLCALMLLTPAACAEGGIVIPRMEMEEMDVPDNEALAFTAAMGVGWNLGNTFDAYRDPTPADEMSLETIWCGVETTRELVAAVKAAGFRTLRIPVSWHNHVDADFRISEPWLSRVQQVVDWAMDEGLYVIVNIHHDDGEAWMHPLSAYAESSDAYVGAIWRQLAERFRDYDEHLIFESMNEPRLKGHRNEWSFDARSADCRDAAACINRMNQLFVDTVRAAGGNNSTRYLMVPAYAAAADNAVNSYFTLPADSADNRIIVSVHAYTPYSFALQDGGEDRFSLSSARQTGEINRFMNALYRKYIQQGIPVVIGEFGARAKNGNLQARVDFAAYYTAAAKARHMPCCWWDNNAFTGNGENFGLLRRLRNTWMYPEIVEAMMRSAGMEP